MRNIILIFVWAVVNVNVINSFADTETTLDIFNNYTIGLPDVVKECDLIVSGSFADTGTRSLGSTSMLSYDGASFDVTEALKGRASGVVKVSFDVEKGNSQRSIPEIGAKSILLVKTVNPGELRVARMLIYSPSTRNLITSYVSQ